MNIEILHCPTHSFYAIAVNDKRVVGSKCCGKWDVIARWPLTRELALQIRDALRSKKRMHRLPKMLGR